MTYSEESIKALYDYAFGYTTDINWKLRTSSATSADLKEAEKISSLMKSQKIPTLYRAMSWENMQKWFGIYKDSMDVWIGNVFVDKGFVSTSKNPKMPWNNYPSSPDTIYLTITSKKPVKAIDINDVLKELSPSPGDKEVLLERNIKFKITGYIIRNKIYHLDLEIV